MTDKDLLLFGLTATWVLVGLWMFFFDPRVAEMRGSSLIATLIPAIALAFYFTYRARRRTRGK